ncbi:hypothetical protein HDE_02536 [Halotydeus destructor]|nr:hypothetical protein HDE_02536 [Halotydeus destructor]
MDLEVPNELDCPVVINLDEDTEEAIAQTSLLTLKSAAILCPGDNEADPDLEPDWLDRSKIARAKQLFKDNLFGFFFGHLCGLVLLVYVQSILKPLLFTRNSRNVACIFRRYLSTLTHVKLWYEGDIFSKDDPARQSILQVRKMHKKVADQLNAHKIIGTQELSISQYDMLITQFAFIGFAILKPEKFGISLTSEDFDCVIHYWRCIGYLLGMDDKFNLCSRKPDEMRRLCNSILEYEMKMSLHNNDVQEAREMSRGILESIRPYVPLIRWDAFQKYLLNIAGENVHKLKLSFTSNLVYFLMVATLQYALRITLVSRLLNVLLNRALRKAHRKKGKISKVLAEKYTMYLGESVGIPVQNTLYDMTACPVRGL